jgi:hypothetical protein
MHVSARHTAASAADQSSFLSNPSARHFLENAHFISIFRTFLSSFNLLPQANRKGPAICARPCCKDEFYALFSVFLFKKRIFLSADFWIVLGED